jgi:RimJ/RimL family protein N-acetyltransferase
VSGPAYRIVTRRLVIRCWSPTDAPLLEEAITQSLEHLSPWMPWAHREHEENLETKVQRLRHFRAAFDLDRDYVYAIFSADEAKVLGGTGLHTRAGEGAREIGYWIHSDHVRKGFATETAAALTRVAFEVDRVRRVEIHCDPANQASASVPRKLGFTHDATLRTRALTVDGRPRDAMIWSLLSEEYPAAPAATAALEAYDALGRRLL